MAKYLSPYLESRDRTRGTLTPVPDDAQTPTPDSGDARAGEHDSRRDRRRSLRGSAGLRQVLDAEEGFEVVAEASDLDGARRYVRGHHPDVLILDLNLPEGLSLGAIPRSAPRIQRPRSSF